MHANRLATGFLAAMLLAPVAARAQTDSVGAYPRGSFFPLMKELVKDRPNLPPPYGVSVVANWIDSEWKFTSASVGINDPNVPVEAATNCSASIPVTTVGAKGDIWVLPFFNVFFTAGNANASNQLFLRGVPVKFILPSLGQPAEVVRGDVIVDFTLSGSYYTFGSVIAGGYKKFFSSVDLSATQNNFGKKDLVKSEQSWTYSAAPRVGYVVGLSQVWVGGRYFNFSTHYAGVVPIPTGQQFSFDVKLKTAAWNLTGGMRTVLKQHWELLLESGFGGRHVMIGSVGYRW